MCYTAKSSITSWWILALMSLFLWYRNEKYDRALSTFVFTLGLIQLIEYGVHSGASLQQAGQAVFLTLWLQCLVLAIGVFLLTKGHSENTTHTVIGIISGWNLFLYAIIFVIALLYTFVSESTFTANINIFGQVEWFRNNGSLLGNSAILYIIGIFVPLFLIFGYYLWADLNIAILLLYGILSAGYVIANYPINAFSSVWCYLAVGFAFLSWFLGILPQHDIIAVNNISV